MISSALETASKILSSALDTASITTSSALCMTSIACEVAQFLQRTRAQTTKVKGCSERIDFVKARVTDAKCKDAPPGLGYLTFECMKKSPSMDKIAKDKNWPYPKCRRHACMSHMWVTLKIFGVRLQPVDYTRHSHGAGKSICDASSTKETALGSNASSWF